MTLPLSLPLRALAAAMLPLTCALAGAAPTLDPAVRERAEALTRGGQHAGIVIAVIEGKDSAVYGFGRGNQDGLPDADTVYEIGSVTKTITGLLLAQAVVAGKVTLAEPVADLLPGYAMPETKERAITLRDLATHYSGLPRLPGNLAPADVNDPYADYGEPQLRAFLAGHAMARASGAAFEYSNLGYGLLGTALAAKAGQSYETLLQTQIAGPLGMRSTSSLMSPALRARLAPGHLADGKPAQHWQFQAIAGAGAVLSTPRDMVAYVQSFMLKPDPAHALAVQPQRDIGGGKQIGLAWIRDQAKGQPFIWHNGQTGGYASFAGFTPDGQRGVVVLSNTSTTVDALGVASLVPGTLAPLAAAPAQRKEVALAPEALGEYVGSYALAPNFVLTVRQGPQGLLVGATGQQEAPVFASGKDAFFYKVVDAQLVFQRNAQGAITGLVLHQNGQAIPGQRKE